MCEMYVTVLVPVTYTSVTVVTSWLLLCTSDAFLHSHIVFTSYLGITHDQNIQLCILLNTRKNIVFCPPPPKKKQQTNKKNTKKTTKFIAPYLEITFVYYILLYNRDLQSCQVG